MYLPLKMAERGKENERNKYRDQENSTGGIPF